MEKSCFYLPVKVLSGRNIIVENTELLAMGRHAFLVTGKNSAKTCGALSDVVSALDSLKISYTVFDGITQNPPLLTCHAAGKLAASVGADFVIGIGGGSPLDAAKAVAAFAANPRLLPADLYDDTKRAAPALPLLAVPTTAGTGSEVNPYSVMTLPGGMQKKTFRAKDSWFRVAFVDPKYTDSLPRTVMVSTALDAFAHALESYLSPKSTDFSENAAIFAGRKIFEVLSRDPAVFSETDRDELSVSATAAGMAISVTGTGFPHPLGYSITLLDGIPHGQACAAFEADFINCNEKTATGKARIAAFSAAIGATPKVLKAFLPALLPVRLSLSEEEIEKRVQLIAGAKNYVNSPYVLSLPEIYEIYRFHFGK